MPIERTDQIGYAMVHTSARRGVELIARGVDLLAPHHVEMVYAFVSNELSWRLLLVSHTAIDAAVEDAMAGLDPSWCGPPEDD